jgi:hypothetical protein
MGCDPDMAAFLALASQQEVEFEQTLTIGRQWCIGTPRRLRAALNEAGMRVDLAEAMEFVEHKYAEPLLHGLGARVIDSLDASDYEGATLVHDLNNPLPTRLRAGYSAVIDGGTLEHVFNFPVALAGCLECVALGGHYLAVTPMNNWAGHGFYQFSPELYFRVLAEQNGFTIRCMLWRSQSPWGRWYRVAEPMAVARRVERFGFAPASLYIAAQRTELRDVLTEWPQQSDYVPQWAATAAKAGTTREALHRTAARRVYEQLPPRVKRAWRWIRWGGVWPIVGRTRVFVSVVLRIRGHRRDFHPVELKNLIFD